MKKRKDTIPVSSQKDDDNYNLKAKAAKVKAMGASRLIMKLFEGDDNANP